MKLFGKKEKQPVKQEQQYYAAGDQKYNDITQGLFVSYLINTYSHYLSNGGKTLQNNYTTMAKYQKCTFAEYCEFIQQGCDLSSSGHFNQERGRLLGAQKVLTDYNSFDQDYLKGICSYVSRVYECVLATSNRSQQIIAAQGGDPDVAEVNFAQLNAIKSDYEKGEFNFTSQGFTRGSEVSSEGGYQNVSSAKKEIASIEAENPDVIPWVLDITAKATDEAQYVVSVMSKDFKTIQPEATVGQ